jgi:MFS family permease
MSLSIYDLPRTRRYRILFIAACISILTPVTDTIILPALIALHGDLAGSTPDSDAALVSVYMGAIGIFNLLWGPLSDRFGRKRPLAAAVAAYIATTLGCLFSPSAATLLVARACQGAVVGATIVCTQAVVADVFVPAERGTAMGLWLVPLLVGPIIAPVIGGVITAAFGWRAIFSFLTALGAITALLVWALPETHQWLALRDWRALGNTSPILEEEAGLLQKPRPRSPLAPLVSLVDASLAPFIALAAISFGGMFVSLTTLPSLLSAPPHYLSPAVMGACFLPVGFAMLIGSVCGGVASDKWQGPRFVDRLRPSLTGAFLIIPGLLGFGFSAVNSSLGGLLFAHVLIGLGQALFQPGFFAFLSESRQADVGGVSAASMALSFAIAGAFISVGPPLAAYAWPNSIPGSVATFVIFALLCFISWALAVRAARLDARAKAVATEESSTALQNC